MCINSGKVRQVDAILSTLDMLNEEQYAAVDFIENEMGCQKLECLHVAFMRSSLIIIEYALYLFSLSTEPKHVEIYGDIQCHCATRSEYPLTTDSERHEKPIGIDIQKRSPFLLYSSQECTRRQKMTESIYTARLHTVKQKTGGKNVAKV